ncbi:WhiB family transcriptional regulator [Saccharopolyspora shandongensis]|uniref:WhiB family transcriptional regulator n=1 Tax=Saccharopolyspora shandongensis TaxID=418495 RepID=UPI003416F095
MTTPTTTAPAPAACVRGHELTDDNTYWAKNPKGRPIRRCRTCRRLTNQRYAARRVDAPGVTTLADRAETTGIGDISWHEQAACVDADTDSFFPHDGEPGIPDRARHAAQTHCADCPVKQRCDTHATERREYGLWGGKWRARDNRARQYRITDITSGPALHAWVDDIAVDRAINGHNVGRPLTPAERTAVARKLVARGHGPAHIAETLGINGSAATLLHKAVTA